MTSSLGLLFTKVERRKCVLGFVYIFDMSMWNAFYLYKMEPE